MQDHRPHVGHHVTHAHDARLHRFEVRVEARPAIVERDHLRALELGPPPAADRAQVQPLRIEGWIEVRELDPHAIVREPLEDCEVVALPEPHGDRGFCACDFAHLRARCHAPAQRQKKRHSMLRAATLAHDER